MAGIIAETALYPRSSFATERRSRGGVSNDDPECWDTHLNALQPYPNAVEHALMSRIDQLANENDLLADENYQLKKQVAESELNVLEPFLLFIRLAREFMNHVGQIKAEITPRKIDLQLLEKTLYASNRVRLIKNTYQFKFLNPEAQEIIQSARELIEPIDRLLAKLSTQKL